MKKRVLRTLLTMIGIFIGIAAVVALISLGQGMQKAINDQFASVGTDKIIVQGASAGFGPPGQSNAGAVGERDLKLVEKTPGIGTAAGRILYQAKLNHDGKTVILLMASMPKEQEARDLLEETNNMDIAEGRQLKAGDSGKVVVGYDYWGREKFDKPIEIGEKLEINGKNFEVIGLGDKASVTADQAIFANEEDIRSLSGDKDTYSMIVAQVRAGEDTDKVADNVQRTIRRDRHQKEGFEDFTVETSGELIESINVILGVLQAIFIGIALVSLFVGGIGIMNTMYTAVLERTSEIGVMKAIGARNSDILMLFIIESGLLGMVGGAIGIALGVGMSKLVEIITAGFLGDVIRASFPWYLIVGALAFSFLVGTMSGLLPAIQASKMQPVEALRD